jgi:hypothetical protein
VYELGDKICHIQECRAICRNIWGHNPSFLNPTHMKIIMLRSRRGLRIVPACGKLQWKLE